MSKLTRHFLGVIKLQIFCAEVCGGCRNYRTWILLLTYGYCFGVELTIENNIAAYFSDQFGKSITAAGNLASIFGLFNFISRPSGPAI